MARRSRKCLVDTCTRRARPGRVVCKDHERTGLGKQLAHEVTKLEREMRSLLRAESPDERELATMRFRRRLEQGGFATLFANRARQLVEQPEPRTFEDELGALRIAMMRVLLTEDDPAKLATAISQITNATVRATRAQEEMPNATPPREHLERSVDKLERTTDRMHEDAEWDARKRANTRRMTPSQARDFYGPVRQSEFLQKGIDEAIKRMEERGRRRMVEWEGREYEPEEPVAAQGMCPDSPTTDTSVARPAENNTAGPIDMSVTIDDIPDPDPLTYLTGAEWEDEYQRSVWDLPPWVHAERMARLQGGELDRPGRSNLDRLEP